MRFWSGNKSGEKGRKLSLSSLYSGRRIKKKKKAPRLILFAFKTIFYLVYFSFEFLNIFMIAFKSLFPKTNIWAISDVREGLYCLRIRFPCPSCLVIFYCILDIIIPDSFLFRLLIFVLAGRSISG